MEVAASVTEIKGCDHIEIEDGDRMEIECCNHMDWDSQNSMESCRMLSKISQESCRKK